MRIISGSLRGKQVNPPNSFDGRPTTDMAREGLFNMLQNYFEDLASLRVLDLFGGTGSISLEFASRGCTDISCVEKDYRMCQFIRQTAQSFGVANSLRVFQTDAFRFVQQVGSAYDVVVADPPFELDALEQLPALVFERQLLSPRGLFFLEHGPDRDFAHLPHFSKMRRYGKVHYSIFDALSPA